MAQVKIAGTGQIVEKATTQVVDFESSMGNAAGVEVQVDYAKRTIVADASAMGDIRFDQWIKMVTAKGTYTFMYDPDESEASEDEHVFFGRVGRNAVYWQFIIVSE